MKLWVVLKKIVLDSQTSIADNRVGCIYQLHAVGHVHPNTGLSSSTQIASKRVFYNKNDAEDYIPTFRESCVTQKSDCDTSYMNPNTISIKVVELDLDSPVTQTKYSTPPSSPKSKLYKTSSFNEFRRLFSSLEKAESYIECGKKAGIESAKEEFVEPHVVRDS